MGRLGARCGCCTDTFSAREPSWALTTLAAEHAAIYVLSACAAQTSRSKDRARWRRFDQAVSAHIRQRDALSLALGADQVPAEPAYALPEMNGPRAVDAAAHSAERA